MPKISELAKMSQGAYISGGGNAGWNYMVGVPPTENNYSADVWINVEAKEIVIASRGTQITSLNPQTKGP